MSNYFFRNTSLGELIQTGAQNIAVTQYNVTIPYIQATQDYQRITTLPYVINTNTQISNDFTGNTVSVESSSGTGTIPIPPWANHYKYNFLGKGGVTGDQGIPGAPGHANNCPMGQAKRPRPGGVGGPGGPGGYAYAVYAPLAPILLPNDRGPTISWDISLNAPSSIVRFSPQAVLTINHGGKGKPGNNGNDGSNSCQGSPGTPGNIGNIGNTGTLVNTSLIPGTGYDTNVIRSTARLEVYFFKI